MLRYEVVVRRQARMARARGHAAVGHAHADKVLAEIDALIGEDDSVDATSVEVTSAAATRAQASPFSALVLRFAHSVEARARYKVARRWRTILRFFVRLRSAWVEHRGLRAAIDRNLRAKRGAREQSTP